MGGREKDRLDREMDIFAKCFAKVAKSALNILNFPLRTQINFLSKAGRNKRVRFTKTNDEKNSKT